MGKEARMRGTFEERKAAAIARNEEKQRVYLEKMDAEADERERKFPKGKMSTTMVRLLMASVMVGGLRIHK